MPHRLHSSNNACSGSVGVASFSSVFLAQGWFRQNGIILSHPHSANAGHWAANEMFYQTFKCSNLNSVEEKEDYFHGKY